MCDSEKRADSTAAAGTPDEVGPGHQHVVDFSGAGQGGRHRDTTSVDALLVQRLFTSHPLPMLVYDVTQLTVLAVNNAFTESYGYARHEVVGQPITTLLPPEDGAALINRIRQVVRPGRSPYRPPRRWRHVWKDGQIRDVDVAAHDISLGEHEAVVALITDVTDRVRAERERDALLARLHEEAAQKAAILEQMGDAVLVADATGRIVLANRAARALLDFDAPDWPDFTQWPLPWTVYEPDGRLTETADRPFARARAGETVRAEYRIITAAGRECWAWITAGPLRDEAGAITGLVWLGRETTEERHRRVREAEGEKLRALGQMASGVAHDLNQYLGLVAGYADITVRSLTGTQPDLPAAREALDVVARAAMDGSLTVNRLLAFAHPAQDGPAELVDIGTLLNEVATLTEGRWKHAEPQQSQPIAMVVDVDGDTTVRGWPAALREAFSNLVFNAVDAMPDGGTIRLAARAEGGQIVATVADSGVGIPDEASGHIFEPFFTTKGKRGTGLGLAIVYGVVERHQGIISVSSPPGRGTTISLVLPAGAAAPAQQRPPQSPATGLRIMAVDDEPAITRMVAMMLTPHGHDITFAASGEEALATIQAAPQPFDVILSDLGLGDGMDGWGLLAAVRAISPQSRFILSTGWGAQIDPSEVVARGGDGLLPKPYRLAALLAALGSAHEHERSGPPRTVETRQ
jgi:PAS domain S-box-containing protein